MLEFYVLQIIGLSVAPILIYRNHYRARTSSTLVLLFWPTYAAGISVWARTLVTSSFSANRVVLALQAFLILLGLAAFVVESLGSEFSQDDHPDILHKGQDHVESPLLTANIFSIWTFSWMSSLMKKGAKAFITEDDLPSLVPQDESANLSRRLESSMTRQ